MRSPSRCPWWYDTSMGTWKYKMEHTSSTLLNVHAPDDCQGEACPVHTPTEHQYRHLPQRFTGGVMYRLQTDGRLIVDPDDASAVVVSSSASA